MKRAPDGAVVRITYDARAEVEPGHALVTSTGRCYVVLEAKQVRSRPGRYSLRAVVHQGAVPEGARVHPLSWYARGLGASGVGVIASRGPRRRP
jgi:hypothetical protein